MEVGGHDSLLIQLRILPISHTSRCACLPPVDSLSGWVLEEQDAWIANPPGPVEFRDCIGIIDATYIRVQRPKEYSLERRLYSTYKKYHALFFVAIIDRRGGARRNDLSERDRQAGTCSSIRVYLYLPPFAQDDSDWWIEATLP